MCILQFLQCFAVSKRTIAFTNARKPFLDEERDITPETSFAQTSMILHNECSIVSDTPDLEKKMEFSTAGKGDAAQSEVVKVWSINYIFTKGIGTPSVDTLEFEMRFAGAKKTVIKIQKYADVIDMDGGKNAVADFSPVFQMAFMGSN